MNQPLSLRSAETFLHEITENMQSIEAQQNSQEKANSYTMLLNNIRVYLQNTQQLSEEEKQKFEILRNTITSKLNDIRIQIGEIRNDVNSNIPAPIQNGSVETRDMLGDFSIETMIREMVEKTQDFTNPQKFRQALTTMEDLANPTKVQQVLQEMSGDMPPEIREEIIKNSDVLPGLFASALINNLIKSGMIIKFNNKKEIVLYYPNNNIPTPDHSQELAMMINDKIRRNSNFANILAEGLIYSTPEHLQRYYDTKNESGILPDDANKSSEYLKFLNTIKQTHGGTIDPATQILLDNPAILRDANIGKVVYNRQIAAESQRLYGEIMNRAQQAARAQQQNTPS